MPLFQPLDLSLAQPPVGLAASYITSANLPTLIFTNLALVFFCSCNVMQSLFAVCFYFAPGGIRRRCSAPEECAFSSHDGFRADLGGLQLPLGTFLFTFIFFPGVKLESVF